MHAPTIRRRIRAFLDGPVTRRVQWNLTRGGRDTCPECQSSTATLDELAAREHDAERQGRLDAAAFFASRAVDVRRRRDVHWLTAHTTAVGGRR